MSWNCQQCEQTNTFKDVFDTAFKLVAVAGIVYVAVNFRSEIKESVRSVVARKKINDLSGTKKRRMKQRRTK